jgi:8-oxo-dGTP diphosphatase
MEAIAFVVVGCGAVSQPNVVTAHRMASMEGIYKIGAVILEKGRLLVVRKDVPGRTEYIVPGGKAEAAEAPMDALQRELKEELGIEIKHAEWLGRFEDQATFENVPIRMDVYIVEIDGTPAPHAEIVDVRWISKDYSKEGVKLGNVLEYHIVPKLIGRGLME